MSGDAQSRPEHDNKLPWTATAFLISAVFVFLVVWVTCGLFLHLALWLRWVPFRKKILFVYSNSPVWQEYIEQNILPRLPKRTIIMNWSERRNWNRFTLVYLAFRYFGWNREFNPMAIVVRPFRLTKCFRFWQPFRDYKHGRPEALMKVERELYQSLGQHVSN